MWFLENLHRTWDPGSGLGVVLKAWPQPGAGTGVVRAWQSWGSGLWETDSPHENCRQAGVF